jgi:hypothetical protein
LAVASKKDSKPIAKISIVIKKHFFSARAEPFEKEWFGLFICLLV